MCRLNACITKIAFESGRRSGRHVTTRPVQVAADAIYEIEAICGAVVRSDGFASGNVYRSAALHDLYHRNPHRG